MPQVDLVEEIFIAAAPDAVRVRLTVRTLCEVWPDLGLRVAQDRGAEGFRYAVSGGWAGGAEVWLEDWADGVIVHVYLRVDPLGTTWSPRRAAREARRRHRAVTPVLWAVKDELEGGRRPGEPATR